MKVGGRVGVVMCVWLYVWRGEGGGSSVVFSLLSN